MDIEVEALVAVVMVISSYSKDTRIRVLMQEVEGIVGSFCTKGSVLYEVRQCVQRVAFCTKGSNFVHSVAMCTKGSHAYEE